MYFGCSIVNYAAEMGARFADNVSTTLQTGSRLKLEASGKSPAFRHFRFQRQAPGVGRLSRLAIIGGACGKVLRAQLLGPYARYVLKYKLGVGQKFIPKLYSRGTVV